MKNILLNDFKDHYKLYSLLVSTALIYWRFGQEIHNLSVDNEYISLMRKGLFICLRDIWINLYVTILIFFLFIYYEKIQFKDKHFSWLRILMPLNILLIVFINNDNYVQCLFNVIDFKIYLSSLLFIIMVMEPFKFTLPNNILKKEDYREGYVIDTDITKYNERRSFLAKEIVDKINSTDTSTENFAIGIVGEWGSGKTVMLNDLKELLKQNHYIVEFRPWDCPNADSIVNDFFTCLRSKLHIYNSSLSLPFINYIEYLDGIEVNTFQKWATTLLNKFNSKDTKNILAEHLRELDKPAVVLIDDLDRLGSDEVFEVLRLIRNTANFPHIVFITAYDKSYVSKTLANKGIAQTEKYIEKIFQIEINLPKCTKNELIELFFVDLGKMVREDIYNWIVKNISITDYKLLSEQLENYREAKRLARLVATQIGVVPRINTHCERNMIDLIWLSLLQMNNIQLYEHIFKEPEIYFFESCNKYVVYDIYGNKREKYEDLNESDKIILCRLLHGDTYNSVSIRYKNNYLEYFYMGISKKLLSNTEFLNLFTDSNRDKLIEEYSENKLPSSIYHHFSLNGISKNMTKEKKEDLLLFVFKFASLCNDNTNILKKLFVNYLNPSKYKPEEIEDFKNYIISLFNKQKETNTILNCLVTLNLMYDTFDYDDVPDKKEYKTIISNDDIKEQMNLLFNTLINNGVWDASDLAFTNTVLGYAFKNCIVTEDVRTDDEGIVHESENNVVYEIAYNYFKEKKSNNKDIFKKEFDPDDDDYYDYYSDSDDDPIKSKRISYFNKEDNYYKFLENCFF